MSDLTELTVPEFIARCAVKGTDDVYDHRDVVALLGNYHALTAENERLRSAITDALTVLGEYPDVNGILAVVLALNKALDAKERS